MRKRFSDKHLRLCCTLTTHRGGFSLAELVVSVGVLVLMLALAGQVMTLTVKSTGQAKAITEVNQQLRIFEQTLREDLRCVDRSQSVMVIQGNPINAYWTLDGMRADDDGDPSTGYPHMVDPEREDEAGNPLPPRADVLMFFTSNRQVVYGHANLGEYPPGGAFNPDPIRTFPSSGDYRTVFRVPADRWHLARRSVSLSPSPAVWPPPPGAPTALDDPRILRGETDVIEYFSDGGPVVEGFNDEELVKTPVGPRPWYLPRIFQGSVPFARSELDLTPPPTVAYAVNQFFLPSCASFRVEWVLDPHSPFVGGRLDGENQVYWFDPGALPPDPPPPNREPYALRSLMEAVASAIVINPPSGKRLSALLTDALGGNASYSLQERFGGMDDVWLDDLWLYPTGNSDRRPYVAAFIANRREPPSPPGFLPGAIIPEDVFPAALRITIDVFDRERRLDRPVRHVIVVPVGT